MRGVYIFMSTMSIVIRAMLFFNIPAIFKNGAVDDILFLDIVEMYYL